MTNEPSLHASFTQPPEFDKDEADIGGRTDDYWLWGEIDDCNVAASLELGFEMLARNPEDYQTFWTELTNLIQDGKLPTLKEYVDRYVEEEIVANNDTWS